MSSESTGQDASQQMAETVSAPAEQMVPQSKVNELVANAKLVSAEKARREMEGQMQQMQMQQQPQSMGGMQQQQANPAMDVSQLVDQKLAEKEQAIYQNQQRQQIEQLSNRYLEEMAKGEAMYPDFKEVTSKFNPVKFPKITLMAATTDNVADVMYDLMSNPTKLTHLEKLLERDEEFAYSEMQKLSQSIKRNVNAAENNVRAPNPLSKLKPSIAGADSGRKTIADWKKIYKA